MASERELPIGKRKAKRNSIMRVFTNIIEERYH